MDTPRRADLVSHPPGGIVYIHAYMAFCQVVSARYNACVNKYSIKCGASLKKWEFAGMGVERGERKVLLCLMRRRFVLLHIPRPLAAIG